MTARGLQQARRLFRAKRFPEVLRLLEPQIFRYRGSAEYYTLLGMSCLYTGEIGGAATYLGRAAQLDDLNLDVLLGLAAVHLKRRELESAMACWLKVLDIQPGNRTARRGLDFLRGSGESASENPPGERVLRSFLPRVRRDFFRPLLITLGALAVVSLGSYGVLRLVQREPMGTRAGVEGVAIPSGRPEIISSTSSSLISFSERELIRAFTRAKRLLLEYRDNLAVHELNRILLSNAAPPVKEKAELLKSFAEPPDFSTFRDPFAYDTVSRSPLEYVDCHVRWKGKAANAVVGEERISFDLLVGYQEGTVLEGVVPVTVPFAATIESGESYEVLGKIQVLEGALTLESVSLRPIRGSGS